VASAGPYANHLHLAPDRQPCQYFTTQVFMGRMPFLPPNQQCQSTITAYILMADFRVIPGYLVRAQSLSVPEEIL